MTYSGRSTQPSNSHRHQSVTQYSTSLGDCHKTVTKLILVFIENKHIIISKHAIMSISHVFIYTFMTDVDLQNLDSKLPQNATYSFRVDASGALSLIDHFMVSTSLCNSVNDVNIVDNGLNLSDHCAFMFDLLLPVPKIRYT